MHKLILVGLICFVLIGCETPIGRTIEEPYQIVVEQEAQPEVFFCPQDNCSMHFIDLARNATKIHCALYEINVPGILEILEQKKASIVVDNDNAKNLAKRPLNYTTDRTKSLMHNKFCVFDDRTVLTGSFNPTTSGDEKSNNNMLIIYSKFLSQNFEDEFNEIWHGGKLGKTQYPQIMLNSRLVENYFMPEDADKGLKRVNQLLSESKSSIYFMTFSFTQTGLGTTLIEKSKQGVIVKGIFDNGQNSRYSQYKRLKEAGLDVKMDGKEMIMHHKVFVIDNLTVITGSWNPTVSGTEDNDENIVIMHDSEIAKEYLNEFESIWKMK